MVGDRTGIYHRAHLEMPPYSHVFRPSFYVPLFAYFMCFRFASQIVKNFMWQNFTGFKAYRLQNLSICLLHSMISGIWTIAFFITHTKEMLGDLTHWYEPWASQLPLISIAYFIHDAFDMLNHEWSRWTLELLLHHIATCYAMLPPLLAHKFLLANYWALLMEGNSIFLHTRTIMQISGQSVLQPKLFKTVIYCNVAS
ncbi:TLC domain-containing protein [Trichostrongylus colubriformis]|uniref:TLC domain-containing protein n=1 Tax=Trichostrongylus colubriformis TaxID=6319 RepID=A0AAN8IUD2_TRICO